MAQPRRKLNLTISPTLIDKAKQVAGLRGSSLSELVEDFLKQLTSESFTESGQWLKDFHKKHLKPGHREYSDKEIDQIRSKISGKYS